MILNSQSVFQFSYFLSEFLIRKMTVPYVSPFSRVFPLRKTRKKELQNHNSYDSQKQMKNHDRKGRCLMPLYIVLAEILLKCKTYVKYQILPCNYVL